MPKPDPLENEMPDGSPEEEIFSFEQLRGMFARYAQEPPVGENVAQPENPPEPPSDDTSETDGTEEFRSESVAAVPLDLSTDRAELSPKTIFEAMLFVGNRGNQPLPPNRAAELMRNVSPEEITAIAAELNEEYRHSHSPYHIVSVEEGYRMELRPEFEPVRAKFHGRIRETRLSQAAIDTLAIVAYKQPVTCDEIQKMRKTACGSVLTQLVRRGLIDTVAKQGKRSAVQYRTTERFLKLFGLNNIADLPMTEEIDYR
ncbi:MAG: SMC-Scp complex subunit ScpB [Planctomycetaceae bacterium]|jgi:segregation and condensation protein B|nr:SMC-Scp complex subunit ScpB [Planctomycetaceae bacterium]